MYSIKVSLCPPIWALLLQIILCSLPTSSFSFSPRKRSTKLWTPLRASGDAYEDSTKSESGKGHLFERIVRKVTKNEDYQVSSFCDVHIVCALFYTCDVCIDNEVYRFYVCS